jgi:hypothetical protein
VGGVLLNSKTVSLFFALNLPTSIGITGIDSTETLEHAVRAAIALRPFTVEEVEKLLENTGRASKSGEYEVFKTSSHFDLTAKHSERLGKDSKRVRALAPA